GPSGPSICSLKVISYASSIIRHTSSAQVGPEGPCSCALHVREARGPVLTCDPGGVGRKADGVIPAREHQQVKHLLGPQRPGQPPPQVLVEVSGVLQGVG